MSSKQIVCVTFQKSFQEKTFSNNVKEKTVVFQLTSTESFSGNWKTVKNCQTVNNAFEYICNRVKGSRMLLDINKFKEAFVEIENKLRIVDITDVPGVTWYHNRAMFLKSLAKHFTNSQRSRNYVSVCSRLFKAANSEDIKDCSAPNAIQMAILDSNCMMKTKLEYLGCVKEIKRLAELKCLVSVRAQHHHWLSETN